jgi:hypothetical protein
MLKVRCGVSVGGCRQLATIFRLIESKVIDNCLSAIDNFLGGGGGERLEVLKTRRQRHSTTLREWLYLLLE